MRPTCAVMSGRKAKVRCDTGSTARTRSCARIDLSRWVSSAPSENSAASFSDAGALGSSRMELSWTRTLRFSAMRPSS